MDRKTKLSIATLMIAALTIGTDLTGALLLLPRIENEFSVDITTTQWVLNLYALTYAVFMVAGGRLGDMYGRRRLMLASLGIFVVASAGCMVSPSIGWLIAARALQGFSAGMLWPSILALGATIAGEERRGMAVGLILAGITSGNVIGPLIAGVTVALGDWRLFFLVNVVLAATALLLVLRFVPREPAGKTTERVDAAGMLVLAGALFALLYALDVGAGWGWTSPPLLGLLVISLVLLLAFPFVEKRVGDPLLPASLMRNREFMTALATNGLLVPSIFLGFLYFPQYLQKVLGWSVLESSFGMLPMMVLLSVGSIVSGRFYDSVGPKRLLLIGYAGITVGSAWVVALAPSWGYLALLPAMLLLGFGAALAVGSAGTVAVSAVAPARAGLAGALAFTVHLTLGAVGVAGGTSIMYASSFSSLERGLAGSGIDMSPADQAAVNAAPPGADAVRAVLDKFGPASAETIETILTSAFVDGFRHAYWLALAAAVVGIFAVLALDERKLKNVGGVK